MMVNGKSVDKFTRAYLECALWSTTDDNDTPLDQEHSIYDFADDVLDLAMADCARFQLENADMLARAYSSEVYIEGHRYDEGSAGHDFWLTRNGHGAGFWDRGLDDVGEALTKACEAFGERWIYIGDDARIYIS